MNEMLAEQAKQYKGLERELNIGSDDEADPDLRELSK